MGLSIGIWYWDLRLELGIEMDFLLEVYLFGCWDAGLVGKYIQPILRSFLNYSTKIFHFDIKNRISTIHAVFC